ncbi:MAG: hypothetical protein NTY38_11120 [Acidobacteria bacterium]|nr:hypothetical protein [Acidobacteriota bacterium]
MPADSIIMLTLNRKEAHLVRHALTLALIDENNRTSPMLPPTPAHRQLKAIRDSLVSRLNARKQQPTKPNFETGDKP